MSDNGHGDGWRTQPLYTINEAARLARVSSPTVRRWLFGYSPSRREPSRPAVFGAKETASPYVSFLELVEIVIAADFRRWGRVSLEVVRKAHRNARSQSGLDYPFAHLRLEPLGGHIVQWIKENGEPASMAEAIDLPGQTTLPGLVTERMRAIDYELDLAARWYPVGKDVPIVLDPRFSTGLPTLVGRGVTVSTLYKRWKADQPIDFIADDLQVESSLVEEVLRYADKIKIAA